MRVLRIFFVAAAAVLMVGIMGMRGAPTGVNTARIVSDMYFGYSFDGEGDKVHVFGSRAELDGYIGELARSQPDLRGMVEGFFAGYDGEFFAGNKLVIALVDRGSGSLRFEVRGVCAACGELEITVDRIIPPIQTKDMRQWVMVLGVDRGLEFGAVNVIMRDVYL